MKCRAVLRLALGLVVEVGSGDIGVAYSPSEVANAMTSGMNSAVMLLLLGSISNSEFKAAILFLAVDLGRYSCVSVLCLFKRIFQRRQMVYVGKPSSARGSRMMTALIIHDPDEPESRPISENVRLERVLDARYLNIC
jgi:hypothetical protein